MPRGYFNFRQATNLNTPAFCWTDFKRKSIQLLQGKEPLLMMTAVPQHGPEEQGAEAGSAFTLFWVHILHQMLTKPLSLSTPSGLLGDHMLS